MCIRDRFSAVTAMAALASLKAPGIDSARWTGTPATSSPSSSVVVTVEGLENPHPQLHVLASCTSGRVHRGHDVASPSHGVGTSHQRTSGAAEAANTTIGSLALATTTRRLFC